MASHYVALQRGVEGSQYSDFVTGTSATTSLFELRILDGVTPKKVEVLKALEAFERFFNDDKALMNNTPGFDVAG